MHVVNLDDDREEDETLALLDHRHGDVQVVQLEELEEVEHEQDPDTWGVARPSAAVVSTDFFRLSR